MRETNTNYFLLALVSLSSHSSPVQTMSDTAKTSSAATALPPAGCPMHEASTATPQSNPASTALDQVNPLNKMPTLAQAPAPGQKMYLPVQRTQSTIPRANSASAGTSACPVAQVPSTSSSPSPTPVAPDAKVETWEYPSPQQFYNALVRKGWETPEESLETIVNIHNWLNEAAWEQVRTWEEKHVGGDRSSLARFEGRPQDLSPKARYNITLGKLFPNLYGTERPFDRHDWLVHRPVVASSSSSYTAASSTQAYTTHRYVIDYYALPDDSEGNPVFSLDVRPALDSIPAVQERLAEWWKTKKESWGAGAGAQTLGVRVQQEK